MPRHETFADRGIPFPLFAAPVSEAAGYLDAADCAQCGACNTPCFDARTSDGLDAPACYECLRAGRVAIRKDTVLGGVSAFGAERGRTDAVGFARPELVAYGFTVMPHHVEPDEPTWSHVCVPPQHLRELVRTPDFRTWGADGCSAASDRWSMWACGRSRSSSCTRREWPQVLSFATWSQGSSASTFNGVRMLHSPDVVGRTCSSASRATGTAATLTCRRFAKLRAQDATTAWAGLIRRSPTRPPGPSSPTTRRRP